MKIYLLRHGQSPSTAEAGVKSDAERPISEEGRLAVRKSVSHLLRQGASPAAILHSPLKRAVQTAEEAAKLVGPPAGVETFLPLSNAMPAEQLLAELSAKLRGWPETLLVGHQPQLGELACLLSGTIYDLRPGGIIALELAGAKKGKALWSANPSDLVV
ncbi:MAG: histidine phosphatase family protein [Elusimicrobia bacterium]|nr:histidine phosphatase family protein [Elusimicrobiota bacterium]